MANEPSANGRVTTPVVGMRVYFFLNDDAVARLYEGEIARINRKTVDVRTRTRVIRVLQDRLLDYNPCPWQKGSA